MRRPWLDPSFVQYAGLAREDWPAPAFDPRVLDELRGAMQAGPAADAYRRSNALPLYIPVLILHTTQTGGVTINPLYIAVVILHSP